MEYEVTVERILEPTSEDKYESKKEILKIRLPVMEIAKLSDCLMEMLRTFEQQPQEVLRVL